MTSVSAIDQLVNILRRKMMEGGRAQRGAGGAPSARPRLGLEAARGLAGLAAVDDQALKRALIQGILADEFGEGLVNSAAFQQMVARVGDALEGEPAGAALLDRIVGDLRREARRV